MSGGAGWSKRDWLTAAGAAAAVVLVAALIAGIVSVVAPDSSQAAVTLEPVTSIGTHPFTNADAVAPATTSATAQAVVDAQRQALPANSKTHTLVANGTAPGLYGGTGDAHLCDAQKLVDYLKQNPDKAAAWAGVLDIAPGEIERYVAMLTPVWLTNDTLVTNHGFLDGHATTLQSVLQAGTAVMVDSTGTPRVKCNCGNPLTPPEAVTTARLQGTGWPGYVPTRVIVVNAGPAVRTLQLINVTTGKTYAQPVGSAPAATGMWVAAEFLPRSGGQTAIQTSTDGKTWKQMTDHAGVDIAGVAWGQGKWLAVSSGDRTSSVLASTDLITWAPIASIAATLRAIAYGNGRWTVTGQRSQAADPSTGIGQTAAVAYTSTDARNWSQVASNQDAALSDAYAVGYGDGTWLSAVGQDSVTGTPKPTIAFLTSPDGLSWTKNGAHLDGDFPWLAYGAGKWLAGSGAYGADGSYYTSGNTAEWTRVPATGLGTTAITVAAYGGGTWLASGARPLTNDPTANIAPGATIFSSSDGATWTHLKNLDVGINALAYGGAPDASPPSTTTPTTPAPATIPTLPPTTPTTLPSGPVAVTACPLTSDITGLPATTRAGPPPASVTMPAGVALPSGGAVYAVDPDTIAAAPAGFTCTATTGLDDTFTMTIVDPANPARFVAFNGGGSVNQFTRGCTYIPVQRAVAPPEFRPAPPPGVSYQALPTGEPEIQAVAVSVPAGIAAPHVNGRTPEERENPTANDVPMIALFIASWGPSKGNVGIGDGLRCALPAEQSAMRNASLLFMLEHSPKFTAKADAEIGLRQFLAAHSEARSGPDWTVTRFVSARH